MPEGINVRELLKEAAEVLGAVQYYIPPADETVEMVPAITADVDACQKLAKRIDDVLAEPEPRKCPDCDGQGWTAQHSIDGNAHDDEGNCNPGYCPVQVQCEKCSGTGKIAAPAPDAIEDIEKAAYKRGFADGMESTAETAREILGIGAAPEPDAMELACTIEKIFDDAICDVDDYHDNYVPVMARARAKAAALIESYGKREERATDLLKIIVSSETRKINQDPYPCGHRACKFVRIAQDILAARYGVEAEE